MSSAHARPIKLRVLRVGGGLQISSAHARPIKLYVLRVGGAAPPAASRCSASLRAPSRGDPPLRVVPYVGYRRDVQVSEALVPRGDTSQRGCAVRWLPAEHPA